MKIQQRIIEKHTLIKDFPPFKKGDIVQGEVFRNTKSSEPATYLYVNKDGKEARIPHSGRGVNYLKPYVEKNETEGITPKPTSKFELTKDFPPLFKKGDIVVGSVEINQKSSEPTTYLYVNKDGKEARIPHSGRGVNYLKPVKGNETEAAEPSKAEVKEQQTESTLFSTKNIVIGVVCVVAVIGILKYKKVI